MTFVLYNYIQILEGSKGYGTMGAGVPGLLQVRDTCIQFARSSYCTGVSATHGLLAVY